MTRALLGGLIGGTVGLVAGGPDRGPIVAVLGGAAGAYIGNATDKSKRRR